MAVANSTLSYRFAKRAIFIAATCFSYGSLGVIALAVVTWIVLGDHP